MTSRTQSQVAQSSPPAAASHGSRPGRQSGCPPLERTAVSIDRAPRAVEKCPAVARGRTVWKTGNTFWPEVPKQPGGTASTCSDLGATVGKCLRALGEAVPSNASARTNVGAADLQGAGRSNHRLRRRRQYRDHHSALGNCWTTHDRMTRERREEALMHRVLRAWVEYVQDPVSEPTRRWRSRDRRRHRRTGVGNAVHRQSDSSPSRAVVDAIL